ncbi:hypothetical protein KPH14_002515 [Odynerus spinipes]|uniref:Uncharacterized protein n=1 Tax=Odynerus spinipes TaxID=1348599 RepID=A0AAD9RS32_9HYME|nr:hypothetical protein KPH14_002515 [Odynerus spinipes]
MKAFFVNCDHELFFVFKVDFITFGSVNGEAFVIQHWTDNDHGLAKRQKRDSILPGQSACCEVQLKVRQIKRRNMTT